MLRKILSNRFEKIWDEDNQRFYYVNKKTGSVDWEKPKLLGSDDVDPTPRSRSAALAAGIDVPPPHKRTPRVFAKDLTPKEAAIMLQRAFRAKQARHKLMAMFASVYQKAYDPEAKLFYYFNSCLLYTSPSPRDRTRSRMPSSA